MAKAAGSPGGKSAAAWGQMLPAIIGILGVIFATWWTGYKEDVRSQDDFMRTQRQAAYADLIQDSENVLGEITLIPQEGQEHLLVPTLDQVNALESSRQKLSADAAKVQLLA